MKQLILHKILFMASQNSFDIVSEIDLQEVDNAVNQAIKEIITRYDLKDSKSSIELNKKENVINVNSLDEFKIKSVIDILQNKMIKRGISLKAMKPGEIEKSSGGSVKIDIKLQQGIDKDNARKLVKMIKDTKLKVQPSINDDKVRVTGKSKDDLQEIIKLLNNAELDFALQFVNYR